MPPPETVWKWGLRYCRPSQPRPGASDRTLIDPGSDFLLTEVPTPIPQSAPQFPYLRNGYNTHWASCLTEGQTGSSETMCECALHTVKCYPQEKCGHPPSSGATKRLAEVLPCFASTHSLSGIPPIMTPSSLPTCSAFTLPLGDQPLGRAIRFSSAPTSPHTWPRPRPCAQRLDKCYQHHLI